MLLESDDVTFCRRRLHLQQDGQDGDAGADRRRVLSRHETAGAIRSRAWSRRISGSRRTSRSPSARTSWSREVDRDTGQVEIKRYVAVDDCGNIINPLLVDGQVHGGVAQGLGQALYEQAVYDENGQLITGELMDYAVPKASMMPWIESSHTMTPSPVNPLGVKGVGEAGTIGCSPAVVNSVVDALSHLGVRHIDMPLTPEKLWKTDSGRRSGMIAQNFEYTAPANSAGGAGLIADGRRQDAGRRHEPDPADEAAAGRAGAARRYQPHSRTQLHPRRGGAIHIGAMTTHYEIESSPLLRGKCPLLAETASNIGDVQVRNMGTIGGSIAHADPAADYPAALYALEAKVRLVSAKTDRTLTIDEFLVDTMTTAIEPGELVLEVIVPVEGGSTGVTYQKMVQPASGFALVGVAARAARRKAG